MKLLSTATVAVLALNGSVVQGQSSSSSKALRQPKQQTHDSPEYAFLVSNISENEDWCITAPQAYYDFESLELQPCDFSASPKSQLWSLDANGKVHSALDYDKCMVVEHGTDIFDGVRIKLARCDLRTSLNRFTHKGGSSKLQVLVNESYCVTNRGSKPVPSDTIHAKPCQETSDHLFTYRT